MALIWLLSSCTKTCESLPNLPLKPRHCVKIAFKVWADRKVFEGPRALGLVAGWAALHQEDLPKAWLEAKNLQATEKIAPLP